MKKSEFNFTTGSLFICNKCGKSFDDPDRAEKLKSNLRAQLKEIDGQLKVRVMVGSCLSVCQPSKQTVAYYPHVGGAEVFTSSEHFEESNAEIFDFIKSKIT